MIHGLIWASLLQGLLTDDLGDLRVRIWVSVL